MSNYPAPVLEIVNGSETINLLARGRGWHLNGFRPRTAELKNGATWQSSPLSNGRQPVSYRYDNIIDTWTVTADGRDEDGVIELAQDLERTGVDALDYWTSDWASTPVYIRARGPKETNTRYAVVYQIRVPEYVDQFRQPMFGVDQPVMEGISIIIEHGQWQNVAPGNQECVEINSAFSLDIATWVTASTAPAGTNSGMLTTASGRLLCAIANSGEIYYSDDEGVNWSLLNGDIGVSQVTGLAQQGGYIYATASSSGAGVLYRSTNDGNTWTAFDVNDGVRDLTAGWAVAASGAEVYVVGYDNPSYYLMKSTDNGSSWSLVATLGDYSSVVCKIAGGDYVLVYDGSEVVRIALDGSSTITVMTASTTISSIVQTLSGRFLVADENGNIYKSDSTLAAAGTWSLLYSLPSANFGYLSVLSDGTVYAGSYQEIYFSDDDGVTWQLATDSITSTAKFFTMSRSGNVVGSDGTDIIRYVPDPTIMGVTTCGNEVYVSNSQRRTNLTSIFYYDAGSTTFTDLFPIGLSDTELFPTTPANGDILYIGIDTSAAIDTGPFSSIVFDLVVPLVGMSSVDWEYWDGSTWSALTLTDKTLDFVEVGSKSIHWVPPSDWATTTVNSVAGWWIRFRIISVASGPEPAQQSGGKQIYAVVNPYIEIAAAQIGGDIPALARIRIENVSDNGGPGGSAPTLYSNRIIAGLRSYSRGALFTAFLNASDEQNPVGVTVTAGTDTSFVDAVGAPSGRLAQWSPAGTASWNTICTFTLATTIATQYYGTFRVFLRARQSGGTAGQMQLRLNVATGSGGVSITTDAQEFANTNDFQILDFGQLTLPLSSYLKPTELGDTLTIAIQGYTSSTTPDCNMYDLVLIPVDEWAADFTDGENSVNSELGSGNYLDIDSVTYPKRQLRNTVKSSGTGYAKAIWQQIANGPAILQANTRQRIWFLSMRTASAGSSDWRSEPDAVHRVQIWSAERYRWARGSR